MKPRRTIINEKITPITRREAIKKCVDEWIRQDGTSEWVDYISKRRSKMADQKYGRIREDKNTFQEDFRIQMSVPAKVSNSINALMAAHQQGALFHHGDSEFRDSEFKWFFKNFPMFRLSEKI
jgi:hypothetical protein